MLSDYAAQVVSTMVNEPAQLHTASAISNRIQIAKPTVGKVLKLLQLAGVLDSKRGAKGGYRLAREASQITLAEIIASIDGKIALTECGHDAQGCQHMKHCRSQTNWHKVNQAIVNVLENISMDEFSCVPKQPLASVMLENIKREV